MHAVTCAVHAYVHSGIVVKIAVQIMGPPHQNALVGYLFMVITKDDGGSDDDGSDDDDEDDEDDDDDVLFVG